MTELLSFHWWKFDCSGNITCLKCCSYMFSANSVVDENDIATTLAKCTTTTSPKKKSIGTDQPDNFEELCNKVMIRSFFLLTRLTMHLCTTVNILIEIGVCELKMNICIIISPNFLPWQAILVWELVLVITFLHLLGCVQKKMVHSASVCHIQHGKLCNLEHVESRCTISQTGQHAIQIKQK